MVLLHGLQQRRLGARACPVDLVGHQQLGEDRTFDEPEERRRSDPSSSTSEPRMSDGIRSGVNCTRRASRPRTIPRVSTSFVFGQPRHADEKTVAARQKRDQRQVDDLFLAENHRMDGVTRPADGLKRCLGVPNDGVVEGSRCLRDAGRHAGVLPLVSPRTLLCRRVPWFARDRRAAAWPWKVWAKELDGASDRTMV